MAGSGHVIELQCISSHPGNGVRSHCLSYNSADQELRFIAKYIHSFSVSHKYKLIQKAYAIICSLAKISCRACNKAPCFWNGKMMAIHTCTWRDTRKLKMKAKLYPRS